MANDQNNFQQAIDLALQGNWPEARRILQRIVEQEKDDDQVWLWLTDSYTSDEARLAILQYGLRRHPDSDNLLQALELQLEKMNDAAAVELGQPELRAVESEAAMTEGSFSSMEEMPAVDIEPIESEPQEPLGVEPQDATGEPNLVDAIEEQEAAERWQTQLSQIESQMEENRPETVSDVSQASVPENLDGDVQPVTDPQPLTVPETLHGSSPSGGESGNGIRSILITAAIIVLIVVLAFLYTRIR